MPETTDLPESYSDGEGPTCPVCGRQYTADGPEYFDEIAGMNINCDNCGTRLHIQPNITTSWTTTVLP